LVDPPGCCIPGLRIGVGRSSKRHGSDLTLDIQFEFAAEFDYQGPGVRISGVRFCIDQKELTPELLFEVDLGLNWKNAGVHLLVKEVLGPLRSTSVLEEGEGPKDFFLVTGELLWGQTQIQSAGVEEGSSEAPFAREVGGREKFRPCSLFRRSGRSKGGRYNWRGRHRYRGQSGS